MVNGTIFQIEGFESTLKEGGFYDKSEFCLNDFARFRPDAEDFQLSALKRESQLQWLRRVLPIGMFKLDGETLTYKSYPDTYFRNWLHEIKRLASEIGINDLGFQSEKFIQFQRVVEKNGNEMLICARGKEIKTMSEWVLEVFRTRQRGSVFYIGSIFEYQF